MRRFRPLASAVLLTLVLTSVALAAPVEVITPGGGNTSLAPPGSSSTGPADATVGDPTPRSDTTASSKSYSPAEVDERPSLQTRHFGGATLSCKVAANAGALVVVNQGLDPLPPGTRIRWQLKHEGTRGFFAIIGELGGGESLVADNVLDGSPAPDDTCVARVI